MRGHYEVVDILIAHPKVDINGTDMHGITALWAACQGKHHQIVKLLLNPRSRPRSDYTDDPLATYQYEVYGNQQLLLRRNYFSVINDENLCSNLNIRDKHNIVADPNIVKNDGCGPIWIAAARGSLQSVKLLLDHGADANHANLQGATPFFVACQNGHIDVISLLLTLGKDLEINKCRNDDGTSPLMIAAYNGYCDIVQLLLSKKNNASLDIDHVLKRTNSGFSVIACVAQIGRLDILKIVHEYMKKFMDKKEIEMFMNLKEDIHGWSALHLACIEGHDDVVKYLVDDINVDIWNNDKHNKRAINYAWDNGNLSIAVWLSQKQKYIV